ncbi:MAG TPA: MBL fold metallo-hydrolase [Polyangiaceae bacterium]|jgi:phosphoribosyl 1,2-cyclic phosphodiesterase
MSLSIRFWGVRGSCPSPGPDTAGVGGNTSCVEVVAGGTRLALDAGTGLRRLGGELLAESKRRGDGAPVELTVLLSHVHWDHIQGLPFFAPIYAPGTRLLLAGGATTTPLRETLRRQMSAPTFPVDWNDLPASLDYRELRDGSRLRIGDAEVCVARANHPDAVFAYRIEHAGHAVVYATDTEHYACVDPRLVALARDADVLVYDAQYLPEEYAGETGPSRVGWGHSTYQAGAALARAAGVRKLVLFHHDPVRTDEGVAAIEARARDEHDDVVAAREGLTIDLGDEERTMAA